MADISLRTYIEEIDGLIDRKQVDEAVAHCRHILTLYPKHLDAYRMLGKALLEKGRHGDAADIFQRVLSVAPDDFIAHVGMSIVREDEANLEAALWHMERAFETNPSNGAIQEELRRLYGRRDGVTPPRARLTRGALARMYALGELYHQAQAEIQAALAEDTDRVDLETTLAQVYFNSGQYTEAAQTCSHLIQKLPYSKEANRILGDILRAQGRAAEAAPYRQRLEAIDPYEAFSDPASNGQGATKVKSEAIRLPKLDYTPGMEDSGAPDWVASAGLKFDDGSSGSTAEAGSTPDWLTNSFAPATEAPSDAEMPDWLREMQPAAAAAPSPELAGDQASNTDWLSALRAGVPESDSAASPEPASQMPDWLQSATGALAADSLPAWMKEEAGPTDAEPALDWMNAPTTALTPPAEETPDWMNASTAALTPPTDMPDWMKTAAPVSEATEPAAPVSEAIEPAADVPAWMQAAAPVSEATEPATDMPDWMQAAAPVSEATDMPDWMKAAAPVSEATESAADVPAWMQAAAPVSEATDMPDWMKTAAPVSEATESAADVPAWMQAAAPVSEATEPAMDMPDWMQAAAPVSEATEPAAGALAAAEKPDWLKQMEAESDAYEASLGASPAAALVESTPAPVKRTLAPDELPDFLQIASPEALENANRPSEFADFADELPVTDDVPAAEAAELPDWLKAMAPPEPESTASAPAMSETEAAQWLAGLQTVRTSAPATPSQVAEPKIESVITPPPEAEAMQPPEWLRSPAEAETQADAQPTTELPDWIKTTSPAATNTLSSWLATKPVPDWMRQPGAEAAAPPPEWLRAPTEAEPAAAELPEWAAETESQAPMVAEAPSVAMPAPGDLASMDADEALRWLESLAAQQGANPEELITQPSVSEAAPVEAVSFAPPAPEPDAQPDLSSMSADEALRWLESLAAQQGAQPEELITQPAVTALLVEPTTLASPESAMPAPAAEPDFASMSPDEAMRWLETLAAQQGANPDELITQPEERLTEPPVWLATPPTLGAPEPVAEPAGQSDMSAMSEDEAMRWLESLAAQQGANPEELITQPTVSDVVPIEAISVMPSAEPIAQPDMSAMSEDDAMRWLESLAAQQGANPDELITTPEERITQPPAWIATTPVPEPVAEAAPEPVADTPMDMSEDDAMRWLETLAAQQGANPDELITTPEERIAQPPTWMAATPVSEPVAEAAPEPVADTPTDMSEDDAMRWLESLAAQQGANPDELITAPEERITQPPTWIATTPVPEPVVEAAPVAEPPPPPKKADQPAPGGTTKLSRLAEQLAAKRRAKDDDIARRFEEQRAEKEAAMREVQDKMEQKKRPGTGPLATRPGTGPFTRPGTGPMTRPGTGPVSQPGPGPITPWRSDQPTEPATAEAPPRKRATPSLTRIARPKKGRASKSPYASQPPQDVFALAQQRLSEGDFDTAAEALNYLVATSQRVDETVTELETFLRIQPEAVALWQVLGDAYMKNNRLQKALDAYRQALGQL